MPVKFHADSEYHRTYQWYNKENMSPMLRAQIAGVKSVDKGASMEPPLQRKKRPAEVTNNNPIVGEDASGDPYMLLGSHDKFQPNIKYRAKSAERYKSKVSKANRKSSSPPPAPRVEKQAPPPPPPPPRPVIDTGAPKFRKSKVDTPKELVVAAGRPTGQEVRPSRSRTTKQNQQASEKKVDTTKSSSQQNGTSALKSAPQQNGIAPALKKSSPPKKIRNEMNEFAQTDLDHGVADSGPEATSTYALKYKAGLVAPKFRGPKRVTEYGNQFTWKKGIQTSPIIDAEQIVYKNNPSVPPQSRAPIPRSSEYKAAFKPWQLIKSTPNLAEQFADDQASSISPTKKKRSRSVEDLSAMPAAGTAQVVPEEDKRLVKQSLNPQRLHFPHGRSKKNKVKGKYKSEYNTNFVPPEKFSYDHGAWKGADPAHAEYRTDQADGEIPAEKKWFQEVLELRKRATEYKLRAQGTHFSRIHLGQLLGKQAAVWDSESASSATIDALDLQHAPAAGIRTFPATADPDEQSQAATTAHSSAKSSRKSSARSNGYDLSARSNGVASTVTTQASTYTKESTIVEDEEEEEGRLPTPMLKPSADKRRHHLDRTTPMVGGALLTSPPKAARPATASSDGSYTPIAGQNVGVQTVKDEKPKGVKKSTQRKLSEQSSIESAIPLGKSLPAGLLSGKVRCTCGTDANSDSDTLQDLSDEGFEDPIAFKNASQKQPAPAFDNSQPKAVASSSRIKSSHVSRKQKAELKTSKKDAAVQIVEKRSFSPNRSSVFGMVDRSYKPQQPLSKYAHSGPVLYNKAAQPEKVALAHKTAAASKVDHLLEEVERKYGLTSPEQLGPQVI